MKQDHRLYTRAQVDFLRIAEAQKAVRTAIKHYNCAIIMALMAQDLRPEKIQEIIKDSESIFDSIDKGALSFEDCKEDILKNIGIDVGI